jgi:FkbM family methyltransferase
MSFVYENGVPIGIKVNDIISENDGDIVIAILIASILPSAPIADLVIDVGADRGWFSQFSRLFCKNTIYAFEPNYKSYKGFVESIRGIENIIVLPIAVSAIETQICLQLADGQTHCRGATAATTTADLPSADSQIAICKPLDSLIEYGRNIAFLKIDTEGHDFEVLRSATSLIEAGRVSNIVFEYTAFWVADTVADAVRESVKMLEWLSCHYKYIYALSRRGVPYMVGPLQPADFAVFAADHFDRHLQTDIFLTNTLDAAKGLTVYSFEPGKYYA